MARQCQPKKLESSAERSVDKKGYGAPSIGSALARPDSAHAQANARVDGSARGRYLAGQSEHLLPLPKVGIGYFELTLHAPDLAADARLFCP